MPEQPSLHSSSLANSNQPANNPADVSLSDLLPDLLEQPSFARSSPPPAAPSFYNNTAASVPPPVYSPVRPVLPAEAPTPDKPVSQKADRSTLFFFALCIGGLLLLPMLVFGVLALMGSIGAVPTPSELERAVQTPLATVQSVTPRPTVNPPGCPQVSSFGPLEPFTCVRFVRSEPTWNAFFAPAEDKLGKDGHRPLSSTRRYDAVGADPARVLRFYELLMLNRGFSAGRLPAESGTATGGGATPLGNYQWAYYAKDIQQVQIVVLTLNKANPEGTVKAGEVVIRMSYTN